MTESDFTSGAVTCSAVGIFACRKLQPNDTKIQIPVHKVLEFQCFPSIVHSVATVSLIKSKECLLALLAQIAADVAQPAGVRIKASVAILERCGVFKADSPSLRHQMGWAVD